MTTATTLQVLYLTGQSDPRSCALSPVQHAFLDELPVPDSAKVRLNFPYDATLAPYRKVPIWLGSLRHFVLFWRIRLLMTGWAARHRPRVEEQLRQADHTLVLAGSIGLDLLGRLGLSSDLLDRLTVVAYGPVATRPPECRTIRVASSNDHLARWWQRDLEVASGHLDYLESPEFRELCHRVAAELAPAPVVDEVVQQPHRDDVA